MPVKRRFAKRRVDPRAEVEAWGDIFELGRIMFDDTCGELHRLTGIEPDRNGTVPREEAEVAWNRLGALFLAGRGDPRAPWALLQFGAPHA